MYNNMMGGMQSTLTEYMESVTQGASQKRLNRPSDDPAGAARVLTYRASLTRSNQHISNTDNAKGWLTEGMGVLDETSKVLTLIREKAQQVSNGTMSDSERKIVANELRQHLGTLMNLANRKYEDKYIFAGETYDKAPYQEGLAADLHNPAPGNATNPPVQVTGSLSNTASVRFERDGTIPPSAADGPMEYQWSEDGGKTWTKGTIPVGQSHFDVGTARVSIPNTPGNSMSVTKGYGGGQDVADLTVGSTLKLRPTMIYTGSDNNASANVNRFGTIPLPPGMEFTTAGKLPNDTLVRFDEDVDMTEEMMNANPRKSFSYSYSTDGGRTWVTGNTASTTLTPPVLSNTGVGGGIKTSSSFVDQDVEFRINGGPVDLNAVPPPTVNYDYSPDGGTTWFLGAPATVTMGPDGHNKLSLTGPGGGTLDLSVDPAASAADSTLGAGSTITSTAQFSSEARLVLPGGYMDVKLGNTRPPADTRIPSGGQLSIVPQRSNLDFEILDDQYITVNNIGKDIFGGLFTPKGANYLEAAKGAGNGNNVFETVGKLIAACETNSQSDVSQSKADIEDSLKNILYHNTDLGGKSNRLDVTLIVLDDQKINDTARKSAVEDVDFTELMTRLTQQQIAYNTVLKSSSMIMQMNLTKFV